MKPARLPVSVALRAGSDRPIGLGGLTGTGALDRAQKVTVDFGALSAESNPLLRELDRRYANFTAPHVKVSGGDQIRQLSRLTEAGRYGAGASLAVDWPRLFAGALVDTGRREVHETSQAGAFIGTRVAGATLSAQYLVRFADGLQTRADAQVGSLKLGVRRVRHVSAEFEAGAGRSVDGRTGQAASAEVGFESRPFSATVRRVRATDDYPVRDRTGLLNNVAVTARPYRRLFVSGTVNGTEQLAYVSTTAAAPTRQRFTRAAAGWGDRVQVDATRSEWTAVGTAWNSGWRREAIGVQSTFGTRAYAFTPRVEGGTQQEPGRLDVPFVSASLRGSVKAGRRGEVHAMVNVDRLDPRGARQDRRSLSAGGNVLIVPWTRVILNATTSASATATTSALAAPWLNGTRWVDAVVDQRLPWSHHLVLTWRRIDSPSAFLPSSEAYRVDYVVPFGVPVHGPADGSVRVRLTDHETGTAIGRARVTIAGRSLLTDRDGRVVFDNVRPGE